MIDITKLQKHSRLGVPPSVHSMRNNLKQPELIDSAVDGRTLRKTGRTHQLATRVTPNFYHQVRRIAARDRIKIVELLERSIDLYEKTNREE